MKKTLLPIALILLIGIPLSADDRLDLISMEPSNQAMATQGFELNEYDWLVNPLHVGKLTDSTLYFSLDGLGIQFDGNGKKGFRGGYTRKMGDLLPGMIVHYINASISRSAAEEENTRITENTWNAGTGQYASINEDVAIDLYDNGNLSSHDLTLHFAVGLPQMGLAVQANWITNRVSGTGLFAGSNYANTAAPSEESLVSYDDRIEETVRMRTAGTNRLAVEPEIGITFGEISTRIALGLGLMNLSPADDGYTVTTTVYDGGVSNLQIDQITTTRQTGAYYVDYNVNNPGSSSIGSSFTIFNSAKPFNVTHTALSLNTESEMPLQNGAVLTFPVGFGINLYPELSTVYETETQNYIDGTESVRLDSRTVNRTTTTLTVAQDFGLTGGIGIRKTFVPSETAALHLGANASYSLSSYKDSRTRSYTYINQADNDDNENFTSAGDTNTVSEDTGYVRDYAESVNTFNVELPLAVSYSPVKNLTFHAGNTTTMGLSFTRTQTGGNDGYTHTQFTDNVNPANSDAEPVRLGNSRTTDSEITNHTHWAFANYSAFGFTLQLTDNFKIDALSTLNNLSFYRFTISGTYTF